MDSKALYFIKVSSVGENARCPVSGGEQKEGSRKCEWGEKWWGKGERERSG